MSCAPLTDATNRLTMAPPFMSHFQRVSGLIVFCLAGLFGGCGGKPAAAPSAAASPAPAAPDPDGKEACVAAARTCGGYVLANNYEASVDCMPNEVLAVFGGRDAMIAMLRKAMAEMAAQSVQIEKSTIELPSQVAKQGDHTFAVLPQSTIVRVKEQRLQTRGYLLGVSSDGGRTWKFVDGAKLTRPNAEKLFPDFPASLTLPEKTKPEVIQ